MINGGVEKNLLLVTLRKLETTYIVNRMKCYLISIIPPAKSESKIKDMM